MDLGDFAPDQKCQNIINAVRVKNITFRDDGLIDFIKPQLPARKSTQDEVDIALDIERLLVERGVSNYQNLAGKTSIQELINIISQLSLFITGDSGPMHLAASFKIPTIAIFGPTNDDETSQYGFNKGIIVKKNLDCQPCMQRSCPLIHHNCMKLITAADVLAAVQMLD
jgi:heptosyltransferase-2